MAFIKDTYVRPRLLGCMTPASHTGTIPGHHAFGPKRINTTCDTRVMRLGGQKRRSEYNAYLRSIPVTFKSAMLRSWSPGGGREGYSS